METNPPNKKGIPPQFTLGKKVVTFPLIMGDYPQEVISCDIPQLMAEFVLMAYLQQNMAGKSERDTGTLTSPIFGISLVASQPTVINHFWVSYISPRQPAARGPHAARQPHPCGPPDSTANGEKMCIFN